MMLGKDSGSHFDIVSFIFLSFSHFELTEPTHGNLPFFCNNMDKQAISWIVKTIHENMAAAAVTNGIVNTLLQLGVAEKSFDEIRFTDRFISHLALYSEYIRCNKSTVGSWRQIFGLFHSDFSSASDAEVRTIIALLDYYLHRLEVRQRN
ncbi:MAG: hypothetical protein ACREAW_09125 [Nitrososphaera sp.]